LKIKTVIGGRFKESGKVIKEKAPCKATAALCRGSTAVLRGGLEGRKRIKKGGGKEKDRIPVKIGEE